MGKSALRGCAGGILTALYVYVLLLFTYFNYNQGFAQQVMGYGMPLLCMCIVILFIEKERLSKYFMSAIIFILTSGITVFCMEFFDIRSTVFRMFYGSPNDTSLINDFESLKIIFMSSASILMSLIVTAIISIIGTLRIKALIDSLEVPSD